MISPVVFHVGGCYTTRYDKVKTRRDDSWGAMGEARGGQLRVVYVFRLLPPLSSPGVVAGGGTAQFCSVKEY